MATTKTLNIQFNVRTDIPPDTVVWTFSAEGTFPKRLPDDYTGAVILDDLVNVPAEVLQVWDSDYTHYWFPDYLSTLNELVAGETYNVTVSDACIWIIPLPPVSAIYLDMNKDELYPYLASGAVAGDWWELTSSDRRELALRIIGWWSASLGGLGFGGRTDTGDMPDWDPFSDPHDIDHQWDAICGFEVAARYHILDGRIECLKDLYYYRNNYSRWEQMWKPDGFGLPFHSVGSFKDSPGHWICALPIDTNVSEFSSWVFFQYEEIDITPGSSWQMPIGAHVTVFEYGYTSNKGFTHNGPKVAEWNV